jgi:hypothetical protein
MQWLENTKPLLLHLELALSRLTYPLTRPVPTVETMGPLPWTFWCPRRHRTNADVMSTWRRGFAFTVGPLTISQTSALPWLPITPGKSTSPWLKFQPPQLILLPVPSTAWKTVVHQQPVGYIGGPTPASSFVSSQEIVYLLANSLSHKQENEMDGNHLVIPCTLSNHDMKLDTHALVDCRCTGLAFMNEAFVLQLNFHHY